VEHLQGSERRVVVLSTVLSERYGARAVHLANEPLLADAGEGQCVPRGIGLFGDPKTLNVAITRPQSVLVCVGDPVVWLGDPLWKVILQAAVDADAFVGWRGLAAPLPPSPTALFAPRGAWRQPPHAPAAASQAPPPSPPVADAGAEHARVLARLEAYFGAREAEGESAWRLMQSL